MELDLEELHKREDVYHREVLMPTRSYEDVVAKSRDTWSPDAVKLSESLSSQLEAEVSRIERGLGNPTRDTLVKLADEGLGEANG